MTIGERIKKRRKELNLSADAVAAKLGKDRSTVYRYESDDIENLPITVLKPLAKILKCKPSYFMSDNENDLSTSLNALRIPVLGRIPAGVPINAIEDILDYEEAPSEWATGDKEFFALKIKGDSMLPEYRNDDVIIFRKQDDCENNDDCAVMVNGNDTTFKRIEKNEKGIILKALNPEYGSTFFTNEEIESLPVRIIGVFWELRRKRR